MNKPLTVCFTKLSDYAKAPSRGSADAAGYDLYAGCATTIPAHQTCVIPTNIAVALPEGTFGAVFARSGLATKQGLRPANCVGVIDSDYRGNLMIALHNDSDEDRVVELYDRIAQLIVLPYFPVYFVEVDHLSDTDRGSGGFGSTGSN